GACHFSLLRLRLLKAIRCSSEQNLASTRRLVPRPASNKSPQYIHVRICTPRITACANFSQRPARNVFGVKFQSGPRAPMVPLDPRGQGDGWAKESFRNRHPSRRLSRHPLESVPHNFSAANDLEDVITFVRVIAGDR